MFNFFRKKTKIGDDPVLKEMSRITEELQVITDSMGKQNESLKTIIKKSEDALLNIGYSQEDLDKIKTQSN